MILAGRFLADSGRIFDRGATLWCRKSFLSPNNFIKGHLMKIERLVTDVTAVGSPEGAECAILGVFIAGRFVGQIRPYLWAGSQLVM